MPKRSKVCELPSEVKAWLDAALVQNGFGGYEALSAALAERGFTIGKSTLHRYGQAFEQRLAAIKTASEQARAVVAAAPDDEGAVGEALLRLVQEQLFQLLMAGDGTVDIAKVARAVAELGRASVTQKKWLTEVRERARAAAAAAEHIATRAGLSADAVRELRREILGIAQ